MGTISIVNNARKMKEFNYYELGGEKYAQGKEKFVCSTKKHPLPYRARIDVVAV